jgi:hypothetical protein
MIQAIAIIKVFIEVIGTYLQKQTGEESDDEFGYMKYSMIGSKSSADYDRTHSSSE